MPHASLPKALHLTRFAFFGAVFGLLGARDMCLGSGGPPPEDPPDADIEDAPSDAPADGSISRLSREIRSMALGRAPLAMPERKAIGG